MILTPQKIKIIKLEEIGPNPYQTRRSFNAKALQRLAASLKEVGMLSPVIVRAREGGYELVCGQRRVRAASMAGMKSVPAIVVSAGDRQCAQLSLIENLQRENLSFFEEAEGCYNLMSYHRIKKDEIIRKLSVEATEINEKVRLLRLAAPIRYKIEENRISEPVAKELLRLHDEEKQAELLETLVKEELGRKDAANLVKEALWEMAQGDGGNKRGSKKLFNMPLCINTVKKTAELLRKNGAKVDFEQSEDEKHVEFTIKIRK